MFARFIMGGVAICFAASPSLAEEVLYCADTQAIGFFWDKARPETASVSTFTPGRFTIKVISGTKRTITATSGGAAGFSAEYQCQPPFLNRITCTDNIGTLPWIFSAGGYTRAFLSGPPVGSTDPNILVAYGTCTKF